MGAMFNQMFAAIAMLFSAVHKTAIIADNLATVGKETSELYVDDVRHKREQDRIKRAAEMKKLLASTDITEVTA